MENHPTCRVEMARSQGRRLAAALATARGPAAAATLCFGQPATIVGTAFDDTITGTAGPDVIHAGARLDTVSLRATT